MTVALEVTHPRSKSWALESAPAKHKRVVIIGGGFAGIEAARALRRCDAEVVLIDRRNHHIFQPLLYQVATAVLAPADIAAPKRRLSI
jgi:NADH:ubiquinone reductase (H+-translocating)